MTRRGRLELTFGRAVKLSPAQPVDEAAAELGRTLAKQIDLGQYRLIPRYLEVLVQLGMTPKSRTMVAAPPQAGDELDELWARRSRR